MYNLAQQVVREDGAEGHDGAVGRGHGRGHDAQEVPGHMCISLSVSLSLSIYIYIYACISLYTYIHICIERDTCVYIYIYI